MIQTTYDISVIICAYTENRWNDLVAAVESVQQQTVPPGEIIVVIDHNPALLKRVREQIPGVFALENQEAKGLSGARNSGALIAKSAVVAFLDDDAVAEPNWIESLVECYADPDVVGVGGKIEPLWAKTRPAWFPDEFGWVIGCTYQGMPTEKAAVRNVIGANMSVRRQVLMAVDGFRESFGCNHSSMSNGGVQTGFKWLQHHAGDEETEFCIRIAQQRPGSTWLYTPRAVIRHRVPAQRARWAYFLWRCYDEGLGKATLVGLHGAQAGLSSERTYTFKALPRGAVRGLTDTFRHRDLTGLARAGAITAGLTTTVAGYLMGTISRLLVVNKGGHHDSGTRL
jgi:glycosyltransferase involved in cell wall biosynthesis